MTCITKEDYDDWTADLVLIRAKLAGMSAAIDASPFINNGGVTEYTFDASAGRQTEKFASPQEMLTEMYRLMARREWLKKRLNGTSIMTTSIRRSRGSF